MATIAKAKETRPSPPKLSHKEYNKLRAHFPWTKTAWQQHTSEQNITLWCLHKLWLLILILMQTTQSKNFIGALQRWMHAYTQTHRDYKEFTQWFGSKQTHLFSIWSWCRNQTKKSLVVSSVPVQLLWKFALN